VHVALLNPNLQDCQGAETFRRFQALAPLAPVVLLLDPDNLGLAEQLVREGAQDFLAKDQLDCVPLARTIRNAVDRHRLLAAARSVAMVDLLTGLLSRAAFLVLAERDLRLAERLGRRVIVVLAEPGVRNRVAGCPDTSPDAGKETLDRDLELVQTAEQLRGLVGSMDLVARIGPNRLAVAILDTDRESAEEVWARMYTASTQRHISLGAAVFDPGNPVGLPDLLERAERDLEPTAMAAGAP
jgi:PleD family two-component response regulator